jgi:hypothetical protein
MQNGEMLEPYALEEKFVEGFGDYEINKGILTFAVFRWKRVEGRRVKVMVDRFAMLLSDAKDAKEEFETFLQGSPMLASIPIRRKQRLS